MKPTAERSPLRGQPRLRRRGQANASRTAECGPKSTAGTPTGASRVSSKRGRSVVTTPCHRRMSERRGGAAHPDTWAGTTNQSDEGAAARIVECTPEGVSQGRSPTAQRSEVRQIKDEKPRS